MLIQNLDVTFSYGSTNTKTKKCDYVQFSLEFLGNVKEDIDFTLHEDYEDVRELIKLKVELNQAETQWMTDFLKATDKKLTIDGTEYQVVNDTKKIDFKLFKKTIMSTHPELKFKKKSAGISAGKIFIGEISQPSQLQGVVQ
jgi:hypothetical protein